MMRGGRHSSIEADDLRQKNPPPVPRHTATFVNPCRPGKKCGTKRMRQNESPFRRNGAQRRDLIRARAFERNNTKGVREKRPKFGNLWTCSDNDLGLR